MLSLNTKAPKRLFRFLKSNALALFALSLCAFILINNSFYSFCWSDEAFYLSTAKRIASDGICVSDWSNTQFYWILIYPLAIIFEKLTGSLDGIYLFLRLATCSAQILTGIAAFFILSRNGERFSALFSSLLIMIFARACINGPSYYVLGQLTFIIGLLSIFVFFEIQRKTVHLAISGVFFAFSVLCNPYLALPFILFSLFALVFLVKDRTFKWCVPIWLAIFVTSVIYILCSVKNMNFSEIISSIKYIFYDPEYEQDIIHLVKRLFKMPKLFLFPNVIFFSPVEIAAVFLAIRNKGAKKSTQTGIIILNAVIFALSLFYDKDIAVAIVPFFYFALISALAFSDFKIRRLFKDSKKDILYFVIPGFVLSYAFCFASNKGFGPCAIGIAVSDIGAARILFRACKKSANRRIIQFVSKLTALLAIAITLYFRVNLTYRDDRLPPHLLFIPQSHENMEEIKQGLAKGLYTHSSQKEKYDTIYQTIKTLETDEKRTILVSELVPWAYITSKNIVPCAPTTWRLSFDDKRLEQYYKMGYDFPDYVLAVTQDFPYNSGVISENSWLFQEIERKAYKKVEMPCGTLFSRY